MIFFEPYSRDKSLFPHDPFSPPMVGVSSEGDKDSRSLARGESEFTQARLIPGVVSHCVYQVDASLVEGARIATSRLWP